MSKGMHLDTDRDQRPTVTCEKPKYESPSLQKLNVDSTEAKFSTGTEMLNGDPATS